MPLLKSLGFLPDGTVLVASTVVGLMLICSALPPTVSTILVLLIVVLAALGSTRFPLLRPFLTGSAPLPPGSMGLPYWGETLDYIRSFNTPQNPDEWYDTRRKKHGNMFKTYIFGSPSVVLLGPAANKFILTNDRDLFDNSWPKAARMLEGEHALPVALGSEHKRIKRAVQLFLGTERLKTFVGRFEELIVNHFDHHWEGRDLIRAHPDLRALTFSVSANLFMSIDPQSHAMEVFKSNYDKLGPALFAAPVDLPWTSFGKGMKATHFLRNGIFEEIKRRQARKVENGTARSASNSVAVKDMLDVLMEYTDEETGLHFSPSQIAQNLVVNILAGQDTTAASLMVIVRYLALSPNILAEVRKECKRVRDSKKPGEPLTWQEVKSLHYLNKVLSEGLRISAPISYGAFKKAKYDIVYEGRLIPKGWQVNYNMRQTQNKAEFFPDPQIFDPSRFNERPDSYSYVPFGQGVRMCPGNEFAKLMMQIFLYHLVLRYDWELVNPKEGIRLAFIPSAEEGLPIALRPACLV